MPPAKPKGGECVQVVVRCRPFNKKEITEGRGNIIAIEPKTANIRITNALAADKQGRQGAGQENARDSKAFTFDAVYGEESTQKQFYEESCFSLVESVLEGFNGTIFAYGQTGCGKTFTMQGPASPAELRGVIPNSFDHIFETIQILTEQKKATNAEFLVRCSYLEIYQEEIRDLLSKDPKKKMELKEDPNKGVFVKDLSDVVVNDEETCNRVMQTGLDNRTVGSTLMNAESSRSHSIFSITIEFNETGEDGKDHFHVGKLNLVDLAGSERQSKTGASGDRLKEGSKINLSLSALGNVISALVDGKSAHIPYRDSKLTRLLQDSLGGNTKTLMMAAISPADYNYEETMSTLRYANRAKNIKNKPKINEDPKDAMLREYKSEIDRLKKMLAEQDRVVAVDSLASGGVFSTQAGASTLPTSQPASPGAGGRGTLKQQHPQLAGGGASPTAAAGSGAAAAAAAVQTREVIVEKERIVQNTVEVEKIVEVEKLVEVEKEVVVEKIVEVEVESKQGFRVNAQLDEYNQVVIAQRNAMGQQLTEAAMAVEAERVKRDEVMKKLLQLQRKVVGSNDHTVDPEVALKRKEMQEKRLRLKLASKKKKEALLEHERQIALGEKAAAEEALQDVLEEAEGKERRVHRMKKRFDRKLAEARDELDDFAAEHGREKDGLLDTIREQNREIQLLEQVLAVLLPPKEIQKVWEKSVWQEDSEEWRLPSLRTKAAAASLPAEKVALPGLGGGSSSAAGSEQGEDDRDRRGASGGGGGGGGSGGMDDSGSSRAAAERKAEKKKKRREREKAQAKKERAASASRRGTGDEACADGSDTRHDYGGAEQQAPPPRRDDEAKPAKDRGDSGARKRERKRERNMNSASRRESEAVSAACSAERQTYQPSPREDEVAGGPGEARQRSAARARPGSAARGGRRGHGGPAEGRDLGDWDFHSGGGGGGGNGGGGNGDLRDDTLGAVPRSREGRFGAGIEPEHGDRLNSRQGGERETTSRIPAAKVHLASMGGGLPVGVSVDAADTLKPTPRSMAGVRLDGIDHVEPRRPPLGADGRGKKQAPRELKPVAFPTKDF